jgi:DNA-binding CsgD family transcriptional regulator
MSADETLARMRDDADSDWPYRLLSAIDRVPPERADASPAELRVVSALSHGLTERMTADALDIGFETVKWHTRMVRRRIGAKNTVHLCCIALREGWIA